MTLREALAKAGELELAKPDKAGEIYEAVIAQFPQNNQAKLASAKFYNSTGNWEKALSVIDGIPPSAPERAEAALWKAFCLIPLGRSTEALESFFQSFALGDQGNYPESHLVFVLNQIGWEENFDYEKTRLRLESLIAEADLGDSIIAARLRASLEGKVKQVYAADERISGFVLFIDLVDSSRYKREHPDTWKKRIIHFLVYTRYAFAWLGFDFLKFIGDEVMMFMPLKEGERKAAAKHIYDFVIRNHWYLSELNRFNPAATAESGGADYHEIKAKIFCGEVRNALLFQPSEEGPYDLVGEDLDSAARIKENGQPNLFVVDEGFMNALKDNGPGYSRAFGSFAWEGTFKGIGGTTKFYGEKVPELAPPKAKGASSRLSGPVFQRRSVREFSDRRLDDETLARILAAAMSAPSAGDQRSWEFVVVREQLKLQRLAGTSPYAGPLAKAQAAVIVCGVKSRSVAFPEYWVQDCSAAMENLLVQAAAEGVGGVWLGYYPDETRVSGLRTALGLPEGVTPLGVAALGYPKVLVSPRSRYEEDRIHRESW